MKNFVREQWLELLLEFFLGEIDDGEEDARLPSPNDFSEPHFYSFIAGNFFCLSFPFRPGTSTTENHLNNSNRSSTSEVIEAWTKLRKIRIFVFRNISRARVSVMYLGERIAVWIPFTSLTLASSPKLNSGQSSGSRMERFSIISFLRKKGYDDDDTFWVMRRFNGSTARGRKGGN